MIYLLMGIAFAVALCFTLISVPLARKIAEKIGAIDVPKDTRRMHKVPTPRLGGLAVFLGFLVSVLCFCEITKETIGLLCGSVIIVILGIFDDSHDLSAKLKLIVQIIAALVTIYIGDIKINFFTNPNIFSNDKILLLSDWISVPCTVLWIVAITNAVNLIDGLDGLAAGVSTIAAVSFGVYSQHGRRAGDCADCDYYRGRMSGLFAVQFPQKKENIFRRYRGDLFGVRPCCAVCAGRI